MKHLIILLTILTSLKCYSQNNADAITGKWLKIPKEDLVMEVYNVKNEYKGKISWSKNNVKKKPVGFVILDKLKDGTLEVNGYMGLKFLGAKKNFKKVN